ncbi:MAG: transglycosylase SLT domain-containing protein [Holophagales bacterium]|nr:transglycosylase SLT domain-containing protein [Holophagales bacterium]
MSLLVCPNVPATQALAWLWVDVSATARSQDEHKVLRLKELVEAAEKALADGNEDAAAERMDEADVFIADWPIELLSQEDVDSLLERMNVVRRALDGDSDDLGLKTPDEISPLTDDDMKSELERVEAAESDTAFDFPIDLNDKVLAFVGAFSGRSREIIQNSLSRGSRYIPMIHQVLAEEGLPLDLAYLPIVESGFRNEARSRAAAVGMWQFIRATGRTYGLQQDSWVDERRDPEKATRAAARFLKHLYETNDDWYLALAGYNAGQGRVNGALQGTGSRNFWDHARSRYLRTETKNYVPQFCAAVLVGKHPERFGLEVAQLEPYEYEIVEVTKSISLITLTTRVGLSPDSLRDLNPELIRRTTPPRRYQLKVPVGKAQDVFEALTAIPTAERLEFRTYKIKKGDTLAKIAARYNTTPEDLLAINNISASRFRVGRNIQVPVVLKANAPAQKPKTSNSK